MAGSNGQENHQDKETSQRKSAYSVNASSMLGLLSEVSKHTESHKRGKQEPKERASAGPSSDRKGKKTSLFDRSNRGIESRSARDRTHMLKREDLSVEARRVLESRERLEKKAELYERLARGENVNGVTREQLREGLLVDFEAKAMEEVYRARAVSDSDDDSESVDSDDNVQSEKPRIDGHDEDDLVETQDELGRTRWVRRSTLSGVHTEEGDNIVHRASVLEGGKAIFSEDLALASNTMPTETTYYGDQRHFHVYEPTPEEIAARRKHLNFDAPLEGHFDSKKEIRNRGAGYMQFSADEEERKKQMDALKNERLATELERQKRDVEGDIASQRQREAQQRRQLIEEKRKKLLEKRKSADEQKIVEKRPRI